MQQLDTIVQTFRDLKKISKRNNVTVKGSGTRVLMFGHGFGCSQDAWRRISDSFNEDYKLVLFDYVGAGNSDLSMYDAKRYNTLEGYAEDVIEICKELEITDATFIGHSVSAMIGALASIKVPTLFKHLIFIAPSPCYFNDGEYKGGFEKEDIESLLELMDEDFVTWAKVLSPQIMGNDEQPELAKEMEQNFCKTDQEIVKQFARVTFESDNRTDLALIKVPSLTLQCSNDMVAPLEVGEFIRDNTPGNTLVIMKATGHCPHMSAPEETVQVIKNYLES